MSRFPAAVALLCFLNAAPASADATEPARSLYREHSVVCTGQKHVQILTTTHVGAASLEQAPRPQARQRSFMKRRPVIAGMLIGMAAGTATAAAAAGSEAAFVGFYGGGLVGAGLGWMLSR